MTSKYYVYGSETTWLEHLRQRDLVYGGADRVIKGVRKGQREMARAIDGLSSEMSLVSAGIDNLGAGIDRVAEGIHEVNATLEWGFNGMLTELGGMRETLQELVQIALTPSHTRAMEHFGQARKNADEALYPECIERCARAIEEYKEEWRPYMLLGKVYLECRDERYHDLALAETNFLLAARYARGEDLVNAALAQCAAGHARYCQGEMGEALAHSTEACRLNPELGEAFYQAARINLRTGDVSPALPKDSQEVHWLTSRIESIIQPVNERFEKDRIREAKAEAKEVVFRTVCAAFFGCWGCGLGIVTAVIPGIIVFILTGNGDFGWSVACG